MPTETVQPQGRSLYLAQPIASVTSVTEYLYVGDTAPTTRAAADYVIWADEGRIERATDSLAWGAVVTVVYTAATPTATESAAFYGSLAGVAAYVAHITSPGGSFDATTTPTYTQVQAFLTRLSARVDGWLAACGYATPVTATRAAAALGEYVNLGAAGMAELAQRVGGYSADDESRRENRLLKEFGEVEAFIKSGALRRLGATEARPRAQYFDISL